jgi:hypothetical protein
VNRRCAHSKSKKTQDDSGGGNARLPQIRGAKKRTPSRVFLQRSVPLGNGCVIVNFLDAVAFIRSCSCQKQLISFRTDLKPLTYAVSLPGDTLDYHSIRIPRL